MNWTHIYAIYFRQLLLLKDNWTRLVNLLLWVFLDVLLWGLITRYLNTLGTASFNFVTVVLGAVVLENFLSRVQQGSMMAFFEDVWSRNFINLFSSPLKLKEYIGGIILTSITTSLFGLLFMVVLAGVFFGYNIFVLGLYLLPFLFILFLFGLSLGLLAICMVLRFGPSAEWLSWPIPFVVAPLAGVFYPVSSLPTFIQPISKILPPSYAFEAMRSVLSSGSAPASNLIIGILLGFMYVFLAYLLFLYIYRSVLRSGLIARFSAESM